MDTTETPEASSLGSKQEFQEGKPSESQDAVTPEASVQSKAKKKKKSGKKKPSDNTVPQQEPGVAEGNQGGEDTELVSVWGFPLNLCCWATVLELIYYLNVFQSAEEQLNRQLDWCIEQLELGMSSQKATLKQSMFTSPLYS